MTIDPPPGPPVRCPNSCTWTWRWTTSISKESRILALGATRAEVQPNPDKWRVLIDPAGHPFCITVMFRPAAV